MCRIKWLSVCFFFFFIIFGVVFQPNCLMAQDMKDFSWDIYSVKFKIPRDFEISENDAKQFIAGNKAINISIFPRKGENLTYDGIENSLKNWVSRNGVNPIGEYTSLDDLNGFWGMWVDGKKDNLPVFQMLIVNPKDPDVSLYVWISYSNESIEAAKQLLLSIKPTNLD